MRPLNGPVRGRPYWSWVADDATLGTAAVVMLGAGTIIALGAALSNHQALALAGGLLAAAMLAVLLTANWIDGLLILTISLPLPALVSTARLRLSPAAAVTALVIVSMLLALGLARRRLWLAALPRWPTGALLASLLLATLFAQHRLLALRELVNFSLFVGLFVLAVDRLSAHPAQVRRLAFTVAGVVGVCGALAALESAGLLPARFPLPGSRWYRAALGFEWPNELAMFLAIGLPLAVYSVETATTIAGRVVALTLLAAAGSGLVATFSRGGWLAVVAGSLVVYLAGHRRFVARIWVGALVGGVVIDLLSGGALSQRLVSTVGDWVLEQRAALTVAGLLMFVENPLVGVGPGGFGESLERFGPQVVQLWDYTGSAHNGYIHMAAEAGLLGLVAMVAFFAVVLVQVWRSARRRDPPSRRGDMSMRRALLWSFATACAIAFVEWPFAHGVGQLIMLVAAMGLTVARDHLP